MKEASGELNLTVITIVAIAAVGAIAAWLWPMVKEGIQGQWEGMNGDDQGRAELRENNP